eukprot:3726826-Pyramimonas_sp.AAC.1
MCNWGLAATDERGVGYVGEATTWLAASTDLTIVLKGARANFRGGPMHRRVHPVGNRGHAAATCAPQLARAIMNARRK